MSLLGVHIRLDTVLAGGLILLGFGLVYWHSLTFVYIEGDDASIVAYHALGRNSQLQSPYSPYHSLFDTLLRLLPPREDVIRVTAIALTAISAPVFLYLVMLLSFDWCREKVRCTHCTLVVLILLAVPELFYLAMILTPGLIAMAMVVAAHWTVRRSTAHTVNPGMVKLAVSLLLFSVGAALRWDTVAYGATIAGDLFCRAGDQGQYGLPSVKARLWLSFGWGIAAALTWFLVLLPTGWTPRAIAHVILVNGPVENLDWRISLSRIQTFVTPGFAVLSIVGLYSLLKDRRPLGSLSLLALFPVLRFLPYGVPKWFITAIPTLIGCAVYGLCIVWRYPKLRLTIVGLLICPWLIGIRWSYGNTAWGPGFEIQPYYRISMKRAGPYATIGPGMAVPTPEGPRPLFGHAWVLFSGWKPFVNEYAAEQESAIMTAINANIPLFLDEQGQNWFVAIYASHGYSTRDSETRVLSENSILERRWLRPDGSHSRLLRFAKASDLFDPFAIAKLRTIASDTVVISAFTSTLIRLQQTAPESLEPLGKRTALLHLDLLSEKLLGSK